MRLATFNINGTRARFDFLLAWLAARKPDVVGLQELKLEDEQFPRLELQAAGYHAVTYGQKSWNGVAILSREPAEVIQRGLPGQDDFGSRLITADVGGVRFTSIYLPNGKFVDHEDFPKKLAWIDSLRAHLEATRAASRPSVIVGDFNICPEPIDSWNEKLLAGVIFHTDAERTRFRRILDLGFVDLFRSLYPDTQAFSWWDYRGGAFHRKQGLRIDLLLATPDLRARTKAVEIDREWRKKQNDFTPSDHAPVFADVE